MWVLIRRAYFFFRPYFFLRGKYYLYECIPEETSYVDLNPRIRNLDCYIVSSNPEADNLAAQGFDFRPRVVNARKNLDKGAVALCIFVDRKIAHMTWIALTQPARSSCDRLSYSVFFHGGEACLGGVFTLPEYRRRGLMKYGCYRTLQWLRDKGVTKVRFAVSIRNIFAQRAFDHFPTYIYGRARFLQFLWLRFYKETINAQP